MIQKLWIVDMENIRVNIITGSVYEIKSSEITDDNRDNVDGWTNTGYPWLYNWNWDLDQSSDESKTETRTTYRYTISDFVDVMTRDGLEFSDILSGNNTFFLATAMKDWAMGCNWAYVATLTSDGQLIPDDIYNTYGDYNIDMILACYHVRPVVTLELNTIPKDSNNDNIFEIKK